MDTPKFQYYREDINWQVLERRYKLSEYPDDQYGIELAKFYIFVEERVDYNCKDLELRQQARANFKRKQYEELYRLQSLEKEDEIQKQISELRLSLGEKGEKNTSLPYIFVTINPEPNCALKDFLTVHNKAISKTWMTHYIYVIEQRGINEDEIGKGFHIHMIIQRNGKKPSHIIRELSNTYKKVCDTSNYHFFNTKQINQEEFSRKLEYILGTKHSDDNNNKDIKQKYDKIFRQKNNLKISYMQGLEPASWEQYSDSVNKYSDAI